MYFQIHSVGWSYLITFFLITIILLPFSLILSFIFFILSCYIYYFFRDPIRSIPFEDFIVSPADGIVTSVGISESPILLQGNNKFIKISIFLNIFNVHVNRIPTTGIIKDINYINGKFINATLDKSSSDNERNIITLEKENKDIIIVSQIAGLIARRIICEIKEKQKVFQGHRFGIIKFGSRVDLYFPSHYKPLIAVGQIVIGGETIMANPNNINEITDTIKN